MNKQQSTALRKLTQIGHQAYRMGYGSYPKKIDKDELLKKLTTKYSRKFKKSSIKNLNIVIVTCYDKGYDTREKGLSFNNLAVKQQIKKDLKEQVFKNETVEGDK